MLRLKQSDGTRKVSPEAMTLPARGRQQELTHGGVGEVVVVVARTGGLWSVSLRPFSPTITLVGKYPRRRLSRYFTEPCVESAMVQHVQLEPSPVTACSPRKRTMHSLSYLLDVPSQEASYRV